MGAEEGKRPEHIRPVAEGMRVTRLELFFDLVFVYALFNIARTTYENFSGNTLLHGMLVLSLLWWCWCTYAWVGNSVHAGEGLLPIIMFAAMATIFVVAIAIPEAFNDIPGGTNGPLTFVGCYFIVRSLSLVVFWYVTRRNPEVRRLDVARIAVPLFVASGLLGAAALLPPRALDEKDYLDIGLWLIAILVEYSAGLAIGRHPWRIASATHWVERYDVIIIVALGELIISIGAGSNPTSWPISWPIIGASVLGVIVGATLWWAYFDIVALAAEQALHNAQGLARGILGRDAYLYMHLPMIGGILLLAIGGEETLRQIANREISEYEPLHDSIVYLLYGGVILYLLGNLGFQLRSLGTVTWTRVGTIVSLGVLIPAAAHVPALAAMGLLGAVCVGLVVSEIVFLASSRRFLREAVLQEHLAHAARQTEWRRRHR